MSVSVSLSVCVLLWCNVDYVFVFDLVYLLARLLTYYFLFFILFFYVAFLFLLHVLSQLMILSICLIPCE